MILIKKLSELLKKILKKDDSRSSYYSNEFYRKQRFRKQLREKMKNGKEEIRLIQIETICIKDENKKTLSFK